MRNSSRANQSLASPDDGSRETWSLFAHGKVAQDSVSGCVSGFRHKNRGAMLQ